MFKKLFIANRGEIAVRIITTCRRLGLPTVVAYSDADADSLPVDLADEAVRIGGPTAADSYLNIDAIIHAVKQTGAEAVHPGFGFLSENAKFAEALAKAGITFVGPNAKAIAAMGDKIQSKALAAKAGVAITPGHVGEIATPDDAVKIAEDIGCPVMIKASAGGGGKGMRVAWSPDEVREGFTAAQNEARGAFGDDRIFIEKFIERPRHVEIQVLGDKHGEVVHLGERECSIQRRNQKVLEEAPSPALDKKTRAEMAAQAVALAKAVDYDSAGTVEFILGQDNQFYFLEMNTRLQVEHGVSEMITGIDLVEHMLRSAKGEPLSVSQKDISFNGWAMEARVYAEDPARGFVPSIGRLKRWRPPAADAVKAQGATLRIDTGVQEGDHVTPLYDPMLAKVITYGPDRDTARRGMLAALDRFEITGPVVNAGFCARVMEMDAFAKGELHTGFIGEYALDGPRTDAPAAGVLDAMRALAAYIAAHDTARTVQIAGQTQLNTAPLRPDWSVIINGEAADLRLTITDPGAADVTLSGGVTQKLTTDWRPGRGMATGALGDAPFAFGLTIADEGVILSWRDHHVTAIAASPENAALRLLLPEREDAAADRDVLSPMPGLVTSVAVDAGADVKAGEALFTIEAMKMENIVRAERPGTLSEINVAAGDSVAADQVLATFAAEPEAAE